jgi:thioredoxin:protein disulfide reductase
MLTAFCLLTVLCASGVAHAQRKGNKSTPYSDRTLTVDVKFAHDAFHAGMTSSALVLVKIKEGWHINAPNPADESLIGTSLEISKSALLDSATVRYSSGVERKFDYADLPIEVYETATSINVRFTVASSVLPGTFTIPASLSYQACSDNVCLAPTVLRFNVRIRVVSSTTKTHRINNDLFGQNE